MDFREDFSAGCPPYVTTWCQVSFLKILEDGIDQLLDVLEAAIAHDINSDVPEEAFHQIHPGAGCWGEMQMESRVACQPSLDGGVLVRAVIVKDQMQGKFFRGLPVNPAEE